MNADITVLPVKAEMPRFQGWLLILAIGDQFAVLSFPDEGDSLAIVHKSWVNSSQDKTLWPHEKNPTKRCWMTIEGGKPTGCWIEVKCIVKCWSCNVIFSLSVALFCKQATFFQTQESSGRPR